MLSWEEFRARVMDRFGPSQYDDHLGVLVKLQQSGFVLDYQIEFEVLLSETKGVPRDQLLIFCEWAESRNSIRIAIVEFTESE